jgi:hypothetical protein
MSIQRCFIAVPFLSVTSKPLRKSRIQARSEKAASDERDVRKAGKRRRIAESGKGGGEH